MESEDLIQELDKYSSPSDAVFLQRFFKTGKGEYGEGDVFIGVRMPDARKVCSNFKDLSLDEIEKLLESPIHEYRMAGLIIMANQSKKKGSQNDKKALFDLYLRRTDRINNWDLVDVSCRDVVGGYLIDKPRDILVELANSKSLWERRIAIVSTWQFIRAKQLNDTYKIADILLNDPEDLIQKAVGWMLREAGKRDELSLIEYLHKNYKKMPRTMLRYSLERLNSSDRAYFMGKQA